MPITKPSLSPEAIRQHYAKYGLYIIVDNTRDNVSPDELYRHASAIDDDDPCRAEKLYLACLRKAPYHALARTNLGVIYFRRGDHIAAEAAWIAASRHDNRCYEAYYNLGYLHLEANNSGQAVRYFKLTVEIDSNFADAWFNLGVAHNRLQQFDAAKKALTKYLELEPRGQWAANARKLIKGGK